eukprot:scaffold29700_cov66-Phaeocystis_antarctica.AAC.3
MGQRERRMCWIAVSTGMVATRLQSHHSAMIVKVEFNTRAQASTVLWAAHMIGTPSSFTAVTR